MLPNLFRLGSRPAANEHALGTVTTAVACPVLVAAVRWSAATSRSRRREHPRFNGLVRVALGHNVKQKGPSGQVDQQTTHATLQHVPNLMDVSTFRRIGSSRILALQVILNGSCRNWQSRKLSGPKQPQAVEDQDQRRFGVSGSLLAEKPFLQSY